MPIRFSPLTHDTLPAVQNFLLPIWGRTWSEPLCDRIFQWRFVERPNGETILALDGDRCVATIDASIRQYLVNDEISPIREPADWHSHPNYRGVGLEPMWIFMRKTEPIVATGGSDTTRALLPRLKWKPLSQRITNFDLLLSSQYPLKKLLRRSPFSDKAMLEKLVKRISIPIGRVRLQAPPNVNSSIHVYNLADSLASTVPSRSEYGLARIAQRNELRWLHSAPPEMGDFNTLVFCLDGEPTGLAVYRLYKQSDSLEATILHIQTSEVSTRMYGWIASESSAHLAHLGAKRIRCRTSCPQLAEALHLTGFHKRSATTPLWWSQTGEIPVGNTLLSQLRADDGILPYPES